MPLTTWAAFQRLDAAPLNASFQWVRGRAALLHRTAILALGAGATVDISMTTPTPAPSFDLDGMASTTGGVVGLTVPIAGLWMLYAVVQPNITTTMLTLGWKINGALAPGIDTVSVPNPTATAHIRVSKLAKLAAGATVTLTANSVAANQATTAELGAFLVAPS